MSGSTNVPLGVKFLQKLSSCCCPHLRINRDVWYRVAVLVITFFSYSAYHLSRKPISVVKNVLNQNCTLLVPPPGIIITNVTKANWCDWAPFNGPDAEILLGTMDSAFLFAYAFAMFFSGMLAERINLRYFLSLGMLLSGVFTYSFGLGYSDNIHILTYFIIVQILCGIVQATGWPGVVTAVGNWFGRGKRGLIFGIWNSHTSVGNILGSLIAGVYVETNWGMSFIVPGAIIGFMGFFVFLFLVPSPTDVGCSPPDYHGTQIVAQAEDQVRVQRLRQYTNEVSDSDLDPLIQRVNDKVPGEDTPIFMSQVINVPPSTEKAISFLGALKIPGVAEYSLCLFFSKLVSYTFLYWLPRYINTSTTFNASQSADLSAIFDVGGIVGGIIAGVISDYSQMSALTCAGMLITAIPSMFLYQMYGAMNLPVSICLLLVVGLLVNGPYALITTAVSADLGTHITLKGNSKALATVTAIIDGTGSIGAALGPLIAGPISDLGWKYVFYMLMVADILALVFLIRLVGHETRSFISRRNALKDVRV